MDHHVADHSLSRAGRFLSGRALALLLTVASAAAWGVCFTRWTPSWLPFLALAAWWVGLAEVEGRGEAFVLGWMHGVVAWTLQIPWIATTVHTYGGLPVWLAVVCLILLALYLGLYHALFALLGRRLLRSAGARTLLALPGLWVMLEAVRAVALTGFPWNLAAYAVVGAPGALALAPSVGAYGVSFLVTAANGGIAAALVHRRWRPLLATALVAALFLVAPWLSPGVDDESSTPHSVVLVQPNTGILDATQTGAIQDAYERLLELSRCTRPGTLIVWPESAAWPFTWQHNARLRADVARIVDAGCALLFNTSTWVGEQVFNSAQLHVPGAPIQRYDKNHLVPFGEYVPLAGLFPFLQRIARAAGDYSPGSEPALLQWAGEALGISICFEIILPGDVARRVRSGATILVTLTNDAWYGDTSAPWQHLTAARFRAAENGRPLLRAAITGISAVIDARGALADRLEVGETGTLATAVAGRAGTTWYAAAPWLSPAIATILAFVGLVGGRRHDRQRGTAAARPAAGASGDAEGVPLTAPRSKND